MISNVKIISGISDHDAIVFKIFCNSQKLNLNDRMIYLYSRANFESYRNDLLQSQMYDESCNDIEANWKIWKRSIFDAVEKNIPKRNVTVGSHVPWIDKEVKKMFKKRKKLYDIAKITNVEHDRVKFLQIRRETKKLLKLKYKQYL